LHFAVRGRRPDASHLGAEGGRMAGVLLHRVEEQPRQGARDHGRNLTTNVTGEPATTVPIARRALAVTTALSGSGPSSRRSFTTAMPAAVVTVSAATGARAVSLVTSATLVPPPAPEQMVSTNTTGRPVRSPGRAPVVPWRPTMSHSVS